MDSAGGNMEFTGFLLYFTSCFYLPLFRSPLASIRSFGSIACEEGLFFFLFCTAGVVASFFFLGLVGVLHIKPVFLFLLFVICFLFFLNPSILVLGIAVTEIIMEVFLFFSAQWRRK